MSNPQDLSFPPGTLIDGYRILRPIGEGSMGVVYEAEQVRLGRRVCLKFIQPGRLESPQIRKLFDTEARALAEMRHPNIVTIYDVGDHEGAPYLAMEFVDGDDLLKFLSQQQPSPEEVSQLIEGIGAAIAHMHQKGIIHRDLKPSNILIDPSVGPKVCDFGVSKRLGTGRGTTDTGGIGSAGYMAPEVLSGRKYDVRADIYSLAVLSFLLLTRRMPEQGQKPSEFAPGLSPETDAVIAKGLQPNPADRYESVRAFIKDFVRSLRTYDPTAAAAAAAAAAAVATPSSAPVLEFNDHPTVAPRTPNVIEMVTPIPAVRGSAPPPKELIPLASQPKTTTGRPTKKRAPDRAKVGGVILLSLGGLLLATASYILLQPDKPIASPTIVSPTAPPAPLPTTVAVVVTPAAATPTPPPAPTVAPTLVPRDLPPLQGWSLESTLPITARRYAFLTAGEQYLYATTFDSKLDGEGTTELYRLELETGAEQILLSLPSQPQKGLSGVAVDEWQRTVYVSFDSGESATAGIYSTDLNGNLRPEFGTNGRLEIPHRALGIAIDAGTLYVLIDWGRVLVLNSVTGASKGEMITLQQGALLRDVAVAQGVIAGYGNGMIVQRPLAAGGRSQAMILVAKATARSTEGLGADLVSGGFLARTFGETDIRTIRGSEDLRSPLIGENFSDHFVDFAVSGDGSKLYASDLLRRSIVRLVRADAAPLAAAAATDAWRPYTVGDWQAAKAQQPALLVFAHFGTGASAQAFRQTIINAPEVLAKLAEVPAFIANPVGGFDPDDSPLGSEPLLVLYNARGAVLARFGPNTTPAEVVESITLLSENK